MPSQIIQLPPAIVATLRKCRDEVATPMSSLHIALETRRVLLRDSSLYISAHAGSHGIGPRCVTGDWPFVLALVPAGTSPTRWPRPLPDEITSQLLGALEPILHESGELSAHERLQIADAFSDAKAASAIGPRPVPFLPPRTTRQRRLRCQGLAIARALRERLDQLDHDIAAYSARLATGDPGGAIVSLSCHAELAARLQLHSRGNGQLSVACLAPGGRWGNFQNVLAGTAAAVDAIEYALERHDPYALSGDSDIGMEDLANINTHLLGISLMYGRAWSWRTYGNAPLSDGTPLITHDQVPVAAIPSAVHQLLDEAKSGRWLGIHPLVHAAIVHTELARIHPFATANGRTARVLLQLLLQRWHIPVLPWEWAVQQRYRDYRQALRESLARRSYEPFTSTLVEIASLAIRLGEQMLGALGPIREALASSLLAAKVSESDAHVYAENLLRGILVESSHDRGYIPSSRQLRALVKTNIVVAVRTTVGISYTVPPVQELLKRGHA